MQKTYSLTSSFHKGSVLQCIEACFLLEEDNGQLILPYPTSCVPDDVGLLIQISDSAASILVGTGLFILDLYSYEIDKHFEVVNE